MELYYHRHFKKQYRNLDHKLQQKTDKVIQKFSRNPRDPRLRNHPLKGSLLGLRAISVTGDVRIVFSEESNYKKVILLRIGTHNQAYK